MLKAWKSTAGLPAKGGWTAARGVWRGVCGGGKNFLPPTWGPGPGTGQGDRKWKLSMVKQESLTLRQPRCAGQEAGAGMAPSTHSLSCTKAGISKVGARGPLLRWLPPAPLGSCFPRNTEWQVGWPLLRLIQDHLPSRLQKQVCGLLRAKQGTQQCGSRTQPASPQGVTPRKKATRVPVTLRDTLGGAKVPAFRKCHLWPGPN